MTLRPGLTRRGAQDLGHPAGVHLLSRGHRVLQVDHYHVGGEPLGPLQHILPVPGDKDEAAQQFQTFLLEQERRVEFVVRHPLNILVG